MFKWFETRIDAFPAQEISIPPSKLFAFVWSATEGMRGYLLAMTVLTAIIGGFEAILFAMMGRIVDWLNQTQPQLLWAHHQDNLLLLGAILLISPMLVATQTMIKHQTLAGIFPMRLRWNFHRLMLSQSMSFYQDEFAGRVASKVMQTALAVRDMWFILADIMVFVTIYFMTLIAIVGSFNTWMIWPFLGWLTLYMSVLYYFVPRLGKVSQEQADARSIMNGRITDAYTNISTVKLFSHAGREAGYAKSSMQEFLGTVNKQMRLVTGIHIINHSLNVLLTLFATSFALIFWTKGQIGVGGVAAVTAMCLRLNGISHWIMWETTSLFEQMGTVQDGINTLSLSHKVNDAENAKPLTIARGEIIFKEVDFAYGGTRKVLDKLNLQIKAGEKVGLVGRSGAGKSTIVNLLLRFYDIESGQILIDGQNIAQVQQNSLRAHIGMVTQDTSLLHRSVSENILYGKPEATEQAMITAAKQAEAHTFIQTLCDPKGRTGYDAHVGERGVKLSGGQRQRIAIARVMLKDAPILLLDEATSALDSEVEAAIQGSLNTLMQGKTVVAIAHRLSTIAAMDRLIVLDQGAIVEEGSHQMLLEKGGLYAKLWTHQSGGFLGEI